MTDTTHYFAYGSNMSERRLTKRVSSAKPIGTAKLCGYVLHFHKHSRKDNSGKCNVLRTGNDTDVAFGRLFLINNNQIATLHRVEGKGHGYDCDYVEVTCDNDEKITALTYIADSDYIDDNLKPYTWYKHHVLIGACESNLPSNYIAKIKDIEADEDPCQKRHDCEMAIYK